MGKRGWRVLGWAVLVLAATPATAGDAPVPRTYPEASGQPPELYASAEERAAHSAAADAAETACGPAAPAACAALGRAFETGEGRPFNRPVAELLYREACEGGDGEGCASLGNLLRLSEPLPRDREPARAFAKACALGQSAYCSTGPDGEALRQLFMRCDEGDRGACIASGRLHAQPYGSREDRPRALALLKPVCDAPASPDEAADICTIVADLLLEEWTRDPRSTDPAQVEAYLERACEAGSGDACQWRAVEFEAGRLGAPDRQRAYAFYQKACDVGHRTVCDLLVRRSETDPMAPLLEADEGFDLTAFEAEPADAAAGESQRRATSVCRRYWVTFRDGEYVDTICVRPYSVVKGKAVQAGTAPWMALLWRPERMRGVGALTDQQRVLCGGSVIDTGWVLTAAHCLDDEGTKVGPASGHRIRLGVSNPFAKADGAEYEIVDAFAHDAFLGRDRDKTLAFDIALIQYDPRPVGRKTGPSGVRRISMDASDLDQRIIADGKEAFVLGWGRTSPDDATLKSQLLLGRVALRDLETCTNVTRFKDHRRDSVICASDIAGQQACKGDSGGPLVILEGTRQRPVLIGVISGGKSCGKSGVPSRFVRLTHPLVKDWLQRRLPPAVWSQARAASR